MSLKINLPEGLEFISGNLSWQGNLPENTTSDVIKASVKSIKVGNWSIIMTGFIDPEKHNGFGGNIINPIYVYISENSAEWRINPPYGIPTGGGAISPDEHLPPPPATFTSTPNSTGTSQGPASPIKVNLSISKLPVLNEVTDLTVNISSKYDAPNSIANIKLPEEAELVSGKLDWQGWYKIVPNPFIPSTPMPYTP